MLTLQFADKVGLVWVQAQVKAHHYLHTSVDVRCSPLAYLALYLLRTFSDWSAYRLLQVLHQLRQIQ